MASMVRGSVLIGGFASSNDVFLYGFSINGDPVAAGCGDGVAVLELASGSGDTLVVDWLWGGVSSDARDALDG